MNTSDYDAEQRKASRLLVESGKTPLPRMAAATLYAREANTVFVAASDNRRFVKVVNVGPNVTLGIGNLNADGLNQLFRDTALRDVCFVDRKALRGAVRMLQASKDPETKRTGRTINYLAGLPAIARCSVLTDVLAQKFWAPTESDIDDMEAWRGAFGGVSISVLADKARTGISSVVNGKFLTSSTEIANLLFRWSGTKVAAFTAVQNHCGVWESVCGTDDLLSARDLLTGSTVRLVPVGRENSDDGRAVVVCEVSTPFKLRPGNNILVFGGIMPKGLPVKLQTLDFDATTQRLVARIVRKKGGKDEGFFFLSDSTSEGKEFFAINEPFTGGSFAGKASKGRDRQKRELPLDVSLAASVSAS